MEASAPTTNGPTPLHDPAERCVVCLDPVSEKCEAQPCRHGNFDFLCLTAWLQHRPACPVCNGRVSEVQYGLHGDGKQPKLRRELRVFESLEPSRADFLLEYIVAILKTIDTQRSTGRAEDIIQAFLGRDNTRILLRELRAWLRSPFQKLCEWDHAVQYGRNPNSRVTTP